MIVFSFNNPKGRYNTTWVGLHLEVVLVEQAVRVSRTSRTRW